MNPIPAAVAALLLGAACGGKEEDSGGKAPDLTHISDTGDCEGTPPVATITGCTYPGLQEFENYDDPVPTIRFAIDVTDEDGDLDRIEVDLYVDAEPDGVIDEANADYVPGQPKTVSGAEVCNTPSVSVTQTLALPTGFVEYGAELDWGARILDSAGLASDMAVITCPAPLEDGTEPDGASGGDTSGDDTGA